MKLDRMFWWYEWYDKFSRVVDEQLTNCWYTILGGHKHSTYLLRIAMLLWKLGGRRRFEAVIRHSTNFHFAAKDYSMSVFRVWSGHESSTVHSCVFEQIYFYLLILLETPPKSIFYCCRHFVYMGPTSHSHSWFFMLIMSAKSGQRTRKPKGHLSTWRWAVTPLWSVFWWTFWCMH